MADLITLRPISSKDYDTLITIRQDADIMDAAQCYPEETPNHDEVIAWIERKVADPDVTILSMVLEDDSCIGYVQLFNWHRRGGYVWYGVVVGNAYQGHGYGKVGTDAVCTYAARQLKARKIMCEVLTDNLASLKMFHSIGFKIVGTHSRHYQKRDGKWCDVHIMARWLDDRLTSP